MATAKKTEEPDNAIEEAVRFDLMAALEGRTYPEDEVVVFMDEAKLYEYNKVSEEFNYSPGDTELEEKRNALAAELTKVAFIVTVRGVSREDRLNMVEAVQKEFPVKRDSFNNIKDNPEADELLAAKYWVAHVKAITGPDGSTMVPSPEEVAALRLRAPQTAWGRIEGAINELSNGTAAGYQTLSQELPFLSQPSLGA